MPLDYEETEKLHEELNALFDQRIKDRVEESVARFMPMVEATVKDHIVRLLLAPTSWVRPDEGGELAKRIKKEAESAADHYIRLFGGAPALREIVEKLWNKGTEEYIANEVHSRLQDAMSSMKKSAGLANAEGR
jgi:hypothetical protein